MKKFGDPFNYYEPLVINHVSIPDTRVDYHEIANLGVKVDRYALAELSSADSLSQLGETTRSTTKGMVKVGRKVLRRSEFSDEIKAELNKVEVGVAPVANVYQISPNQPELSDFIKNNFSYFNYYLVELGLNVSVGHEAKIPKLKFEADLYSDGEDRTDVTTYSVAPTDSIKRVKIVDGKINIGINNLLKLIPGPIDGTIPNLIDIEINPIEFKWERTQYEIDVTGPLNYNVSWLIYGTDVVQSFHPLMILKARKELSEITAKVRVLYELRTSCWSRPEAYSQPAKSIFILPD